MEKNGSSAPARKSRFDPRLRLEHGRLEPGLEPIPLICQSEWITGERLRIVARELQSLFPCEVWPRMRFKPGKLVANSSCGVDLFTLSKDRKTISYHWILAHPQTPSDIFRCAVYAGLLVYFGASRQKKAVSFFDHGELVLWYEQAMSLMPAAEFFERYLKHFFKWALNVGKEQLANERGSMAG